MSTFTRNKTLGSKLNIGDYTLPEELGGETTGIQNVNVANDAVVATFNAAGAKVAANAKGLVIKKLQSGKVVKVMNK